MTDAGEGPCLTLAQPIPAFRVNQTQLRSEVPSASATLVGLTDRLIDAVDTVEAILRRRLPATLGRTAGGNHEWVGRE
jgi:hypothetical protein